MKKEIPNSYLSFRELTYHASVIGIVICCFELVYYVCYFIFVHADTSDFSLAAYLVEVASNVLSTLIYAVSGSVLAYPIYRFWVVKKNGLTIVLNNLNESDNQT